MSSRRSQGGYLLEIPIILFILVIVLSVLMPHLGLMGQKILLAIAAVPVVFCLFYMIVIPGWVPGISGRAGRALRVALFVACTAAIAAGVGAFIFRQ